MNIVRPITIEDLDQLYELALLRGVGLTSLPKDKKQLRKKILSAQRGFNLTEEDDPAGEQYLFVLEDVEKQKLVGVSGIHSKVGGFEPFYTYQIEDSVHESKSLKVSRKIPTLHLVVDHDGPSEVGTLFLHPDYRQGGNGRFLSLTRFLYMAQCPDYFDELVIAEIRGVIDENGGSPFWDALGSHFFVLDFNTADELSAVDKKFIADLMPKHPIYIPTLPQAAQDVIGEPNDKSRPAMKILEKEGFEYCHSVDIFEAGPTVSCQLENIRTIKESKVMKIGEISDTEINSDIYMISNNSKEFRACMGNIEKLGSSKVRITSQVAQALKLNIGDECRFVLLRPNG